MGRRLPVVKAGCRTCGGPIAFPGSKECTNCWETEHRLGTYLRSARGRAFAFRKLAKACKMAVRYAQPGRGN